MKLNLVFPSRRGFRLDTPSKNTHQLRLARFFFPLRHVILVHAGGTKPLLRAGVGGVGHLNARDGGRAWMVGRGEGKNIRHAITPKPLLKLLLAAPEKIPHPLIIRNEFKGIRLSSSGTL